MAHMHDEGMDVRIKRVYANPERGDGHRVLLDRMWPRGVTKEKAHIHYWARALAPTSELRQWFGHDPERWPKFRKRYLDEIRENKEGLAALFQAIKGARHLTLVFAARDEQHNNAVVMQEYLQKHFH